MLVKITNYCEFCDDSSDTQAYTVEGHDFYACLDCYLKIVSGEIQLEAS